MTNGKRNPWTFTPNNCQVLFLHSDLENYSYVALTSEVITLFWKVNKLKQNFFLLCWRNAQYSVLGLINPYGKYFFFHRLLVHVGCQRWVWGLGTISAKLGIQLLIHWQVALPFFPQFVIGLCSLATQSAKRIVIMEYAVKKMCKRVKPVGETSQKMDMRERSHPFRKF